VYYEHGSAHLLTHPCHEHRGARPWHSFDLWKSSGKTLEVEDILQSMDQWIGFSGKKSPKTIDFPSKLMGFSK